MAVTIICFTSSLHPFLPPSFIHMNLSLWDPEHLAFRGVLF